MKEDFEEKWEKIIDNIFLSNPKKAQYMIEYNWKYYLDYFLLYFAPHIKKNNSQTYLLDIGCGAGLVSQKLSDYGFLVYGADFSKEAIKFAKSKNHKVNFQYSSVYNLPFKDEKFDIVICLGVFQTIVDRDEALVEMSRVLKRGGIIVIRTLNKLSLSYFKTKKDNPDFSFYNPFIFKRKLEELGFTINNIKGIYLFPKSFNFLTDLFLKIKVYKLFNFFFSIIPIFFAHSFYIEAVKQ